MTSLLGWLKTLRRAEPVTAAEIRRRLAALRHQYAETIERRDASAFDAANDDGAAAERWGALDKAAIDLLQRVQVLVGALPAADAREADAARQAEVAARQKRMADFERQTAEAQAWLDAVLARLPDGETLTAARDWRNRLHGEARALRAWSNDVRVRRPVDPLDAIYTALGHRAQRIERARWIHGDHPITLLDDKKAS